MKEYILCGHPGRCCARLFVSRDKKTFLIQDDYNGEVRLTKTELQELKKLIKKLE